MHTLLGKGHSVVADCVIPKASFASRAEPPSASSFHATSQCGRKFARRFYGLLLTGAVLHQVGYASLMVL